MVNPVFVSDLDHRQDDSKQESPRAAKFLVNHEWIWSTPENCATLLRNRARLERSQAPWAQLHLATSPDFFPPGEKGMSTPSNRLCLS